MKKETSLSAVIRILQEHCDNGDLCHFRIEDDGTWEIIRDQNGAVLDKGQLE